MSDDPFINELKRSRQFWIDDSHKWHDKYVQARAVCRYLRGEVERLETRLEYCMSFENLPADASITFEYQPPYKDGVKRQRKVEATCTCSHTKRETVAHYPDGSIGYICASCGKGWVIKW